jgi:hypothetical protein
MMQPPEALQRDGSVSFALGEERISTMKRHDFFSDHYEVMLIASNIALMAMVIFFMALSTAFQIVLLIASALSLAFMLRSGRSDEPPCGASIGFEGIARPRPGFELRKE